MQDPGE